jgi:hypothetical protein
MWGELSVSDTDDDESKIYLVSDCCRIITQYDDCTKQKYRNDFMDFALRAFGFLTVQT